MTNPINKHDKRHSLNHVTKNNNIITSANETAKLKNNTATLNIHTTANHEHPKTKGATLNATPAANVIWLLHVTYDQTSEQSCGSS